MNLDLSKVAVIFDLRPQNGGKSFYGKAKVIELLDGTRVLLSYETPVAYKTPSGKFHRLWDSWTPTTGRHLEAFGIPNKAAWDALPVEKA